MGKKNTYVVYEGRNPGVYDSWPEAHAQVNRYSNNCYKGYNSAEAAVKDMVQHTQSSSAAAAASSTTTQPPPSAQPKK